MRVLVSCLLISYISIWASCNKNLDCRGTIHNFEAFLEAYPAKDSIHIGDTIWVEMWTPTRLKDITSGETIDYSGAANFGTVISYVELMGGDVLNPGAIAAANHFDIAVVNGTLIQPKRPDQLREFLFEEKNGMYLFKVGIVPKKTGLFLIGPGNAAGVYQNSNSCRKSDFKLTFENTDQHLYLLEQSRPGYTPSDYERTHAYCFKVY